jgi:hypothetical protein
MKKIITAILMVALGNVTWAQMDTSRHVLLLKDGTKLYGYVKEEHSDTLYFLSTLLGDLAVPRPKIYSYYKQNNIITPSNIAIYNDRYFMCESAYGLQANTGYITSSEIYINKAAYGVTDLFSVEVGSSYNADLDGILAYLGGKYSIILNQNLRVAYRIMIGTGVEDDNPLQYRHEAMLTYGNRISNISISYYYEKASIRFYDLVKRNHFFSLSGRYQFTNNLSFVFENIIANKNILLANIGISKDYLGKNWSIGLTTVGWLPNCFPM